MKLFLIKIGKAFHVLKRDGLLRGGQRIFSAFCALFRRVGSGDILFITGGVGDSARYRCHHVAEELERQSFRCGITVQDNPFLARYADKFSVFVFHRVLHTSSVAKFVECIKRQNKTIIFETDDLVYDPSYLQHMDYFQKMNALERKLYEHGVGGEILADPLVTTCTTTTSFLADKLRKKGKKVFIVPNKLSMADVKFAEKIRHTRSAPRGDAVTIGYFSGTPSHDKDFGIVADALVRIFEKYPHTRLLIAGPLSLDEKFAPYRDRIMRRSFASRKKHFANIASIDINLAPLEIGNPFCESKSELKFFEAGIVGVPTVASATQPFREAISDGIDGFVATTTDEWIEKISLLVENADSRRAMGANAHEKTLQNYTTENAKNEEYYAYVREKIKK